MNVAGCPLIITRGAIVGETEGVESVEEVGDPVSPSDGGRITAEDGNSEFVIKDDVPPKGNGMDDVARTVGGT